MWRTTETIRFQTRDSFTPQSESNKSQRADWLVFALHLFSPSGVPVLKGESRVRSITVFILEVCEYTTSEWFRFLKYCDEAMVRSRTQLNQADRPMLNTVSCVKSFVFNMLVTLMICSYRSAQICSATKPTFAIPRHSLDSLWPVRESGTGMCIWHSPKLAWHQGADQCQAKYLSLGFVRKSASFFFRYSTIIKPFLDIYYGFRTCTMVYLVNACMHMVLIQYHIK